MCSHLSFKSRWKSCFVIFGTHPINSDRAIDWTTGFSEPSRFSRAMIANWKKFGSTAFLTSSHKIFVKYAGSFNMNSIPHGLSEMWEIQRYIVNIVLQSFLSSPTRCFSCAISTCSRNADYHIGQATEMCIAIMRYFRENLVPAPFNFMNLMTNWMSFSSTNTSTFLGESDFKINSNINATSLEICLSIKWSIIFLIAHTSSSPKSGSLLSILWIAL